MSTIETYRLFTAITAAAILVIASLSARAPQKAAPEPVVASGSQTGR